MKGVLCFIFSLFFGPLLAAPISVEIPKNVEEIQQLEQQATKEFASFMKEYKKIHPRNFNNTIANWNLFREKIIHYTFLFSSLKIANPDEKLVAAGKEATMNLGGQLLQDLYEHIFPIVINYLEKAKLETLTAKERNIAYLLLSEIPSASLPPKLGKKSENLKGLLSKYPMEGFQYLKGEGKEKIATDQSFSALTLNVCAFSGALPMLYGGPTPWKDRIDSLTSRIKEVDADVIALQEVFDSEAAVGFYQRLKDRYSYFYLDIGPRVDIIGTSSGLFVASKYKIANPKFTLFDDREMVRSYGFFDFTIKSSDQTLGHITTTHLQPFNSESGKELRAKELKQIVNYLNALAQEKQLPFFLCGDLNIQWGSNEPAHQLLSETFIDNYNKNRKAITKEDRTCRDFTDYWWKANRNPNGFSVALEVIDYALLLKTKTVQKYHLETKRIPMGDLTDNSLPDTDHDGLFSKVQVIK
jgi:endonuclease/exonuclease/phosphatase family metal-dependent hydrolase